MRIVAHFLIAACFWGFYMGSTVFAGEADVIKVKVDKKAEGIYDFAVTVQHADEGWDHYADGWEIVDDQGNVLATRVLHHPHVNEQPFTRGLSGVTLPADLSKVTVRAHDSVHDHGGRTIAVDLP